MKCQAILCCLAFLCLAVRRDESGSLMMTHASLQLHKAARCIQRIFRGRISRDLTRKLQGMRNQYELLNTCPACGSRYADHPVAWLMKPVKDGGQGGSGAVCSEEVGVWTELTACCGVCLAVVCNKRAEHWWKSGKLIPDMLPVMMGNVLRYLVAENDEGVEVDSSLWETRPKPDAVLWLRSACGFTNEAQAQDGEGDVRAASAAAACAGDIKIDDQIKEDASMMQDGLQIAGPLRGGGRVPPHTHPSIHTPTLT
jgi:hypothetical protein